MKKKKKEKKSHLKDNTQCDITKKNLTHISHTNSKQSRYILCKYRKWNVIC